MIANMKIRREVGAAAARIEASTRNSLADMDAERNILHKKWRDLLDEARTAQTAYEAFMKTYSKGDKADHTIIAKAKLKYPAMRFFEHDDHCPMTCLATGLAIFEDDVLFGDAEYGAVLVDAVSLSIEPITKRETQS